MGKSSTSVPIPRRGVFVAVLLGTAAALLGLWSVSCVDLHMSERVAVALRERNWVLAGFAGSWVPVAALTGVALLAAVWVGNARVLMHPDRLVIYGRSWPVRIPAAEVIGFSLEVTRSYRGTWTEVVALEQTGSHRRVCQMPGEPERCRGLPELLRKLNAWCGADVRLPEESAPIRRHDRDSPC